MILPTSDTVATGPMVSDVTQQRDQRAYLHRTQWRLAQWYRTSHNRETSDPTYIGHSGDWPNGIGRHTTERPVILPTSDTVATGPMVSDVTQQRDQRAYLHRTQWRLAQWYRTSHNRETSDPTYIGHSGDWPNGIGRHTTERPASLPTSDTVATGPMVSDVTQQRDQRSYLHRTQWRLAQWYRTSHNRETSDPTYIGHSGDWPNGIGRHTTAVTQRD